MSSNFWTTLPGILTGIGGVLASAAGLYQAITTVSKPQPSPTPTGIISTPLHSSTTVASSPITVDAKLDQGTPYQNPYNRTVKVNFKADGQWQAIPKDFPGNLPKGYISAKGEGDFSANSNRRCPGFALGALIVSTEQNKCLASGDQGTFDLQPNQTAYFLMNDVSGLYGDNAGSLQVSLSLTE